MNLFKKAIVASAVAASFGASAVTVSSTPAKLSAEGVAAGNAAAGVDITNGTTFDIDFVVGELTPASSTITLEFEDTVVIGDAGTQLGTIATDCQVVNNIGNGTGIVDPDCDGTTNTPLITFDYGTGSFTFDKVNVDTSGDNHVVSFNVNLGNPLVANSAFRLTVHSAADVTVSDAATVTYTSTSGSDTIETGMGTIATTNAQFTAAVSSDFDGVIERVSQKTFVEGGSGTPVDADAAIIALTNNQTGLLAPVVVTDVEVTIDGDFDNGATGGAAITAAELTFAVDSGATGTADALPADLEEAVFGLGAIDTDGSNDPVTITFDGATKVIPVTGEMSASVEFTDGTYKKVIAAGDAGEWKLDATVINVPYFPVGFEGTSTSVHFANEASSSADVIVTGIDAEGNEYGPVNLGDDLAGNTVTKVAQGKIMSLFGLTESAKLSVTFNIDADDGDVNAYAFTTDDTGRTEISNSQLKGK